MSGYSFDWGVIARNWDILSASIAMTFVVSLVAEGIALFFAIVVGIARTTRSPLIVVPATAFVEFFRGVPILVLLIWVYYVPALAWNVQISAFIAGVFGLGLWYAGGLAETIRAGILAVPVGQREAAYTLGLSRLQVLRAIVLPQATRIVIPPLANSYIGMVKDATLLSVLGVTELMRAAQTVVGRTYRPFEVYTFIAVVYVIITVVLGRMFSLLERRLKTA
jgi:His/Glu/Gln/Arg/opine family amino acid ABC transporter permease subunit